MIHAEIREGGCLIEVLQVKSGSRCGSVCSHQCGKCMHISILSAGCFAGLEVYFGLSFKDFHGSELVGA